LALNIKNIIDFRDSLSSISLLKVSQVFGKMNPSEILEIRGADFDIQQDLLKVLPQAAYEIVRIDGAAEGDFERLCIRKRG
jgi:TusA-related sulfurtransferase